MQVVAEALRDWRRRIPTLSGITFLTPLDAVGIDTTPRSVMTVTMQPTKSRANVPFEVSERVITQTKNQDIDAGDATAIINSLIEAHAGERNNYRMAGAAARIHWIEFKSANERFDAGGNYEMVVLWRGKASW